MLNYVNVSFNFFESMYFLYISLIFFSAPKMPDAIFVCHRQSNDEWIKWKKNLISKTFLVSNIGIKKTIINDWNWLQIAARWRRMTLLFGLFAGFLVVFFSFGNHQQQWNKHNEEEGERIKFKSNQMKLQEIETSVLDQKKRLVKKLFYGMTTMMMMMMMRKAIIIDLKSYRITDTITSSIDAAAAWNINHTFVFIYFSFVLFSFVINDY